MNFVSVNIETTNASLASICQIGIVRFENGQIADKWSSLIDPEGFFDSMNVSMHGIDVDDVVGAPTFQQAATEITLRISGQVVAALPVLTVAPSPKHAASTGSRTLNVCD